MKRGKFIVIDGVDGSGKGTEIELLKEALSGTGTIFTHEPVATKRGEEIRKILMARNGEDSPASDFFLFWAARAAHIEEVIKPALRAGKNVICDRFDSSTFAYQIIADGHPELAPLCAACRKAVLGDCIPDAYIFLDLPVSVSIKRLKGDATKTTKYDIKPTAYHEAVRNGFKEFAKKIGLRAYIVDANRTPKKVDADVWAIVSRILDV